MESVIGLGIQSAGVVLIAVLFIFTTRSIRRTFLDYWSVAWGCLSVSLVSLAVASRLESMRFVLGSSYLFFEYAFGLLLIAGCRNYARGYKLSVKHLNFAVPAAVLAGSIALIFPSFNSFFIPHAAIMAAMFAVAFRELRRAVTKRRPSPGERVMLLALAVLSADFAHYVVLFLYARVFDARLPGGYLQYTSIYDLIFEMLLGFGTVMLVMDNALREVESTNRELVAARDRLEVLARIDPLTEALNRHAFYSLLEKQHKEPARAPGCAVVLDIDNLKPINDSLGHAAGDEAIRQVAQSIRSVIRADDQLFRWGGDEFLILLFNMTEQAAHARVTEIDSSLASTTLPGSTSPLPLIVSYGLSPFNSMEEIESAIEQADSAMYARKQSRKSFRAG